MITGYNLQTWLRMSLQPQPESDGLAMLVERRDSQLLEQQSERLATVGNVGPMTVHRGEVRVAQPIEHQYAIQNEKFSQGVQLPGSWLRNDRVGDVRSKVAQLGTRYRQWPARLVASLVSTVATDAAVPCITGKTFFATDHTLGKSGTFSNLLSFDVGTASAPTPDEAAQALWFAASRMIELPDDVGEPMNEDATEFALLVHPRLAPYFQQALTAATVALTSGTGARDNVLAASGFRFRLMASPRLTNHTDRFTLVRLDRPQGMPAFIMQENAREARQEILGEDSPSYKKNDIMEALIYAVGNAGFGWPQMAMRVNLT